MILDLNTYCLICIYIHIQNTLLLRLWIIWFSPRGWNEVFINPSEAFEPLLVQTIPYFLFLSFVFFFDSFCCWVGEHKLSKWVVTNLATSSRTLWERCCWHRNTFATKWCQSISTVHARSGLTSLVSNHPGSQFRCRSSGDPGALTYPHHSAHAHKTLLGRFNVALYSIFLRQNVGQETELKSRVCSECLFLFGLWDQYWASNLHFAFELLHLWSFGIFARWLDLHIYVECSEMRNISERIEKRFSGDSLWCIRSIIYFWFSSASSVYLESVLTPLGESAERGRKKSARQSTTFGFK